ncbi:hypothetical protein GKR72_04445 [Providencia stuartii]|uniref:Acid shock protein n=1 Tax=Providencia stuartii ATCC 25827 TaxID=471874 RepID=A0AA87CVK6_PROST|nr:MULTISPECIES: hypothetical protein [Providencia]EDU60663.1 hypothetical protein PROSTU_01197 [Providencia stuartii ATCC 25827]MBS7782017.1 hypothetical protein [Providencia thailandensis]MTC82535.1 hypothetical protein [Providencia stuartii]MTC92312.1 hypothetical protein [Providencia stuartii]
MKRFILLALYTTLILPTMGAQASPRSHHTEAKISASPVKAHKNKKPTPPPKKKKAPRKHKSKIPPRP